MQCTALILIFLSLGAEANAGITEREIDYTSGDVLLKGLLAYDAALPGRRPAVLVVHEWAGLNAHARHDARRLAAAVYVAPALHMYGKARQAHRPMEALMLSTQLRMNLPPMHARSDAARDPPRARSNVNPRRLAAIGYCFAGGVVRDMARAGEDLRGVVSVHGVLDTTARAKAGAIKAQVLVLTGGAAPCVTKDQVDALALELGAAGARCQIVTYPGAKHSSTNPAAKEYDGKEFDMPGDEYSADTDQQSWTQILRFWRG